MALTVFARSSRSVWPFPESRDPSTSAVRLLNRPGLTTSRLAAPLLAPFPSRTLCRFLPRDWQPSGLRAGFAYPRRFSGIWSTEVTPSPDEEYSVSFPPRACARRETDAVFLIWRRSYFGAPDSAETAGIGEACTQTRRLPVPRQKAAKCSARERRQEWCCQT